MVFTNHFDIANGLSSAQVLISCGFLADALTVLRPAVEHLIDIRYLKRWPSEIDEYYGNTVAFFERFLEEGYTLDPEDLAKPFRFKNIKTVINQIGKQRDQSEAEEVMVVEWKWLSNLAQHSSAMRKMINRKTADDWQLAIRHVGWVSSLACEQLFMADSGLNATIIRDVDLAARYDHLVRSEIVRAP